MKGILIEPGKAPGGHRPAGHHCRASKPCWAATARRRCCPHPGGAGVRHLRQEPEPYLSRPTNLWHYPLLRWRNNRFQPLNKDLQAEMLDRLKDTEVRV